MALGAQKASKVLRGELLLMLGCITLPKGRCFRSDGALFPNILLLILCKVSCEIFFSFHM
jgi:hypothetical protein